MAENVQWIKLIVGMFDGESFKKIKRARIGGEKFRDKLTAVWFELLDFAGKCNHHGAFINAREIPFVSMDDIAAMIDREPDELQLCMRFFISEGMIEIVDDVYMLSNWTKYQNTEGLDKIREQKRISQAKWRAKKKALAAGSNESEIPDENNEVDDDVDGSVDSTVDSFPLISNISTSTNSNIPNSLEIKGGVGGKRGGTPPPAAISSPIVISIILNDKTEYPITEADVEGWKDLYPAVDVMQELRKMKGWADANPRKRKTKAGIKRFINAWLSKEQDRYHGPVVSQPYHGGYRNAPPSGVDRILEMMDRGDFDE